MRLKGLAEVLNLCHTWESHWELWSILMPGSHPQDIIEGCSWASDFLKAPWVVLVYRTSDLTAPTLLRRKHWLMCVFLGTGGPGMGSPF